MLSRAVVVGDLFTVTYSSHWASITLKMRQFLSCLLILIVSCARAQYYPFTYPAQHYFRSGINPEPSYNIDQVRQGSPAAPVGDARLFFSTFSLTFATSTSTTYLSFTSYCTTSTSALKVWYAKWRHMRLNNSNFLKTFFMFSTPSGRRRRGIALDDDKKARGLYYNENEEEVNEHGTIFLPSPKKYSPIILSIQFH